VEYKKMRGTALRNSIMKTVIFYTVPQIERINVVEVNTNCSACWVGKKCEKCLLKSHGGETIWETYA
jgi:hypothetical protein